MTGKGSVTSPLPVVIGTTGKVRGNPTINGNVTNNGNVIAEGGMTVTGPLTNNVAITGSGTTRRR